MFKVGKTLVVVESVEKAIKFYTERLGFALHDVVIQRDGELFISSADVKKGNVIVNLRAPAIEELAEFGMVKRCSGRSAGLFVEMNKGVSKYFQRCKKKGVPVITDLNKNHLGQLWFAARDPFGLKLIFIEKLVGSVAVDPSVFNAAGLGLSRERILSIDQRNKSSIEPMVDVLKDLGLLKRISQKFVRTWVKQVKSAAKNK
ncbi:VOC family protein [Candidatus Dependentiae bacterium]|nr:VOC family protein [Candidatus Dependentiae bacterium]